MTSTWAEAELATIEAEDEVVLASNRSDGSQGSPVTIWIVAVGDDVFVRSAHGAGNRWFARAQAAAAGHVTIGDVSRNVEFEDVATSADHVAIDDAYHAKYDGKYPKQYVDPVVDERSHGATLRVVPA